MRATSKATIAQGALCHQPKRELSMNTMTFGLIAGVTLGLASVSAGQALGPQKAAEFRGAFVMAYEECSIPNSTIAESFGGDLTACSAPVRSDPICGFGPGGSGKFSVAAGRRGLKVTAKLFGLEPACEGHTLRLRVQARATTEACSPSPCTLTDIESSFVIPAGPCLVRDGECRLGGAFPAADLPNVPVFVSVGEVSVNRGDLRSFVGGVRLPIGQRTP
jgi:hypothetical protein